MDKKSTVILFSGSASSGKDYVANIMKEQLEEKGNRVLITHYADLLKYILKTYMEWDGEKDEKGRSLLQNIGTEVIRKQEPDFWVNFVVKMITMLPVKWDYILIPDARFLNEIELIKQNPNFKTYTIKVVRKDYESNLTLEQKNHSSETSLKDYKFDYYINNDINIKNTVSTILRDIDKKIAFIDLDGVVFDTISCIVDLYNEDFKYYPNFKEIKAKDIYSWNFDELNCAEPEQINTYFNQPRFFERVKTFPSAKDTINELSSNYRIIFISHGNVPNLNLKKIWIEKYFPYAEFIGVDLNKYNDKSCVDMSGKGNVFIDDKFDNLNSSNANIKICFGETYPWNADYICEPWNGKHNAYNWEEVRKILL